MTKNRFYVKWSEMDTIIKEDGSLDKAKVSWLDQSQTNALIAKLHLNWQQLKVQNSILQGKINTYEASNKRLNESHAQVDLDLYDMTEKHRALEKRFKKLIKSIE